MKLFYSKILLFGEYGIIKNSKGLVTLCSFYEGTLKTLAECEPNGQKREDARKSNEAFKVFTSYLGTLANETNPIVCFSIRKLDVNITDGMYLDSSIPQRYGVDSSGTLVTAIYSEYAIDPISAVDDPTREKFLQLKAVFGRMESFFHGTSPDLGLLNSYLSLPIPISSYDSIESTGIPTQTPDGEGVIPLLDSGIMSETAPTVHIFTENIENKAFQRTFKERFIKYTDACIDDFPKGRSKSLFDNTKNLSSIVLSHSKPMIPKEFHTLWKQGINTGDYFLELCGPGGGGYILGFTEDLEKAKHTSAGHKLGVVYQF